MLREVHSHPQLHVKLKILAPHGVITIGTSFQHV
jgi:hypothetical protein